MKNYSDHHLLMPEPWLWYETIRYASSYQVAMHRHSAWQLTASLSGEFRFRMVERTVILKPGDWVLMSPELLHDAGSDSPSSHAIQIFFRRFPPDLLPEFARRFNLRRGICRSGHISVAVLKRILSHIRNDAGNTCPYGKSWRSLLGMEFIVNALSDLPPEPETVPHIHPKILRTLEYMEEHFAEPLAIADFAALAGLSENRFAEVFKQETGSPPMQFFNSIRLGHAQGFLLNGAGIAEAALAAGFSSVQYFCRFFRKNTGITPGAFRNAPFSCKMLK